MIGTTPIRRDFHYPQRLVSTSPHERIIKRFIERSRSAGESDDEVEKFILFINLI